MIIPWPHDFEFMPSHHEFAAKHGKSLMWLRQELRLCENWNTKNAIRRTPRGWVLHFTNWLKQAILFESEQAAGETAYGNGAHCAPRQPIQPPLDGREIFEHSGKYKQLLKDNPEAAKAYLAKVPERIRKLIK